MEISSGSRNLGEGGGARNMKYKPTRGGHLFLPFLQDREGGMAPWIRYREIQKEVHLNLIGNFCLDNHLCMSYQWLSCLELFLKSGSKLLYTYECIITSRGGCLAMAYISCFLPPALSEVSGSATGWGGGGKGKKRPLSYYFMYRNDLKICKKVPRLSQIRK